MNSGSSELFSSTHTDGFYRAERGNSMYTINASFGSVLSTCGKIGWAVKCCGEGILVMYRI